jgi:PAS domain S-box-containing protein
MSIPRPSTSPTTAGAEHPCDNIEKQILEDMLAGYWDWDIANGTEYLSPQFKRMFGYADDQMENRPESWQRIAHPEDLDRVLASFERHVASHGREPFENEVRYQHKNGSTVHVLCTGRVVEWGAQGEPLRAVGCHVDITAQKQAEQLLVENEKALRQERERLRGILRGTNAATWEWNVQTGEVTLNERWADIIGYTLAELEPISTRTWERFAHPEDRQRSVATMDCHFNGELDFYECEVRMRHKDGSWVWVLDCGRVAVWTDCGKPLVMMGTLQDISRRKRSEAALRASEARFKEILQGVETVAVQGYGMDGTVRYWNRAATRFYGYTEAEAMGRNLLDLIIPEAAKPVVAEEIRTMVRTRQPMPSAELTLQRKDGSAITVFSSHSYVEIPGQEPELFCIDVDLSERKLAEERLLLTNKQLEETTARANELAQRADAANRAKSEFLANMSHEIRTPMNGVIGMIELLLDSGLSPLQRSYAEVVSDSAEALLAILNDILDFSKIEAGKLKLESIEFDLKAQLEDFAAAMALRARQKGLRFACVMDPQLPARVTGDPGRLRQILTNLVGNAIKFTEAGEVAIHVAVPGPPTAERLNVEFSVTDTGIGIAKDKQAALFHRFEQLDASMTRKYGGTGLGLAIVQQLCDLMGGRVTVESDEGKGATFRFTLSLGTAAVPPGQVAVGKSGAIVPDGK